MPSLPDHLSALNVIGLSLTSSVVAALLTQWFTGHREKSAETKEGKFAAHELAMAFEAYAAACSELIYDSENFRSSRGHGGEERYSLPVLPDFPDLNWRALGIEDTVRAKSFRTELDFHHGSIADTAERTGEGSEWELAKMVRHKAAKIGLEAAGIAQRLRADKGVTPLNPDRAHIHLYESVGIYGVEAKADAEAAARLHEELFGAAYAEKAE